ncbi:MAG: hypothetical protein HDS07_05985 [Bacteroides sp.]|nr:hypothetical protein [Bacteroides sp.]
MKDERKHKIASTIYTIAVTTKKVVIRELKFIWKPLLLGIAILVIFATIGEWNNQKEFWCICGIIGLFLPTLIMYYKRLKIWVLKWK